MRNLILVLAALIAVVTFIRAYDRPHAGAAGAPMPGSAAEAPALAVPSAEAGAAPGARGPGE